MDLFTHPVMVGLILALAMVIVFGELLLRAGEKRRVDAIVQEGKEQKDSTGRSRDSRKQGAASVGFVIENSDRPQSGRSEGSMEERANRLQGRRILVDRPQSLRVAEHRLIEASNALKKAQQTAVVCHHAEIGVAMVRQAEGELEARREEHNRILIESRDRSIVSGGRVRTGPQIKIGVAPRGAA